MPNPVENHAVAPAAESPASHKLRGLFRKRLRQLLRITLGLAGCLAMAAGFLAIWWVNSLNGLPDIGDPFDRATIGVPRLSDEENAFTFLRRASKKFIPLQDLPRAKRGAAATVAWSQADPKLRAWVEANRPALELIRQGAERSDGIWDPSGDPFWLRSAWMNHPILSPGGLMALTLLEGGRRAEGGDPAGAWDCYRAVLRMTNHLRRRGSETLRFFANALHAQLRRRLETWAADPTTTIPQLRRALDEAMESRPRAEWDVFSLKLEYLEMMRFFGGRHDAIYQAVEEGLTYRLGGVEVPTDLAAYVFAGRRFLLREPERSRRAVRLLFANWLAHVEVPVLGQAGPAVRASFSSGKSTSTVYLYPVGAEAPAGARAISPHEVASWFVTTNDAKIYLQGNLWPSVSVQERMGYRQLVVLLAREIYRRERGGPPASEEALVGTYLESLPDDGSAERGDGTAPILSDSRESAD